jgi:hypothetical protein
MDLLARRKSFFIFRDSIPDCACDHSFSYPRVIDLAQMLHAHLRGITHLFEAERNIFIAVLGTLIEKESMFHEINAVLM